MGELIHFWLMLRETLFWTIRLVVTIELLRLSWTTLISMLCAPSETFVLSQKIVSFEVFWVVCV